VSEPRITKPTGSRESVNDEAVLREPKGEVPLGYSTGESGREIRYYPI